MQLAIGQVPAILGNIQGNIKTMEKLIIKAQKKCKTNLDLIVFPELFVTGYNLRDGHNQVAEKIPGNGLAQTKIHDLAKKYNIHIITGIVEKSGKSLFNSNKAFKFSM